jgi:hypothetical protein
MHPVIPTLTSRCRRGLLAVALLGACGLHAADPPPATPEPKKQEALYITIDDVGEVTEVERVVIDPLEENPVLSTENPYVLEEQTFKYETGISVTATTTHVQWPGESRPYAIMDGNMETRWSSDYKDDQRVTLDLGKLQEIAVLRLHWETAAPAEYIISVSDNGRAWAPIYELKEGKEGPRVDDAKLGAKTRWVRLDLKKRTTEWGFSLWEMQTLTAAEIKAEEEAKAAAEAPTPDGAAAPTDAPPAPDAGKDEVGQN